MSRMRHSPWRKTAGESTRSLSLPSEPAWLSQVHGSRVVRLGRAVAAGAAADAVVTAEPGRVCVIQVADCLPVLFAARDGVSHWRGPCRVAGPCRGSAGEHRDRLGGAPGAAPGLDRARHRAGAFRGGAGGPRSLLSGPREAGRATAVTAAFSANARGRWQCDSGGPDAAATGGLRGDRHPWGRLVYVRGCGELLLPSARWALGAHGGLDLAYLVPTKVPR